MDKSSGGTKPAPVMKQQVNAIIGHSGVEGTARTERRVRSVVRSPCTEVCNLSDSGQPITRRSVQGEVGLAHIGVEAAAKVGVELRSHA